MPNIEVIPNAIELPKRFLSHFKKHPAKTFFPRYKYSREPHGFAECFSELNLECIVAQSVCPWHDDPNFPKYSALLVIRNDADSYVESEGISPIVEQPVGTFILLNIHHNHQLACNQKFKNKNIWIAAVENYNRRPKTENALRNMRKEIERAINRMD